MDTSKYNQFPGKEQAYRAAHPYQYGQCIGEECPECKTEEKESKDRESRTRSFSKIPNLRPSIIALQNTYPALTFMEQFNQAAQRGELIK